MHLKYAKTANLRKLTDNETYLGPTPLAPQIINQT